MVEALIRVLRGNSRAVTAFWPAFWLATVLIAAKAYYLAREAADPPGTTAGFFFGLLAISYADVVYAAVLGLFHGAALAIRRFPRLRDSLHAACYGLYLLSAVYAVANLVVFGFFMTPLTYPLVCLAGDPTSFLTSIAPFLTTKFLLSSVGALCAFLLLVILSEIGASAVGRRAGRVFRATVLALAIAWTVVGRYQFFDQWNARFDRRIAENPHWTFLVSAANARLGEMQITLADPVLGDDLDDFATVAERRAAPNRLPLLKHASFAPASPMRRGHLRNVILLVMESVAARWLDVYGSPFHATPNLAEEARHALVFNNFYSPAGRSSDALASILLSVQPHMSWRDVTSDFPQLPGTSLADLLRERGYRTGFVTSSDLGWANWKDFLAERGFDSILQDKDLDCGAPLTSWGVEDHCLVDGMLRWIPEDPSRPFFLMAWTVQTHHPYEPSPDRPLVDFFGGRQPIDAWDLGRYLNVLHETDRQIGRLFELLRRRGLDDDTIVVIVGDHGEAFGDPHEVYGHGTALYEENVHVPMMLWSPRLFPRGGRSPIIGSHLDLNQTIVDLLGVEPAASWQGRSLFDSVRRPRAYFFVANDSYKLGVRENEWKYILDATNGREELYDLSTDPEERVNQATEKPKVCQRLRQRLAARVEVDRRFFAPLAASL